MKYDKPALTIEAQAALLLKRGLIGEAQLIEERLRAVGYYRLSGYWYPFRKQDPKGSGIYASEFDTGSSFTDVWARYAFDRQLRVIVLDAIERIEVAVRSELATRHAARHGPFAYAEDASSFPHLLQDDWNQLLSQCGLEQNKSQDQFVKHFAAKYDDVHEFLPVWMAMEIMSFGTLVTFLRGSHAEIKNGVSSRFMVDESVFRSWMVMLNTVRNIVAHHGRLWNRTIGTQPKIPLRLTQWHQPVHIQGGSVFAVLSVCRWCVACVAPQSKWYLRVLKLLDEYPSVPHRPMGFPPNWRESPIWSEGFRVGSVSH